MVQRRRAGKPREEGEGAMRGVHTGIEGAKVGGRRIVTCTASLTEMICGVWDDGGNVQRALKTSKSCFSERSSLDGRTAEKSNQRSLVGVPRGQKLSMLRSENFPEFPLALCVHPFRSNWSASALATHIFP